MDLHGWPLDTRSLSKGSTITPLLPTRRVRGCLQGEWKWPRWSANVSRFASQKKKAVDEKMLYRSHLPLMFVGMEHILLSNYRLADEALDAAYTMCDGDPLLINERAVMAYNHGE